MSNPLGNLLLLIFTFNTITCSKIIPVHQTSSSSFCFCCICRCRAITFSDVNDSYASRVLSSSSAKEPYHQKSTLQQLCISMCELIVKSGMLDHFGPDSVVTIIHCLFSNWYYHQYYGCINTLGSPKQQLLNQQPETSIILSFNKTGGRVHLERWPLKWRERQLLYNILYTTDVFTQTQMWTFLLQYRQTFEIIMLLLITPIEALHA